MVVKFPMIFFLLNEKRLADFVMENGRSFHLRVSSISYQEEVTPPLFVDQTESPPPLSQGLDDQHHPPPYPPHPPPYLKVWICY